MAWVKRLFSKGEIDRAGATFLRVPEPSAEELDKAFEVLSNWRACHSYPLQAVKMTLLNRARHISPSALIAQRLKRFFSIFIKLSHNPNMKLSQMQDIGGCRAVMPSIKDARRLIAVYDRSRSKNPRHGRPIEHERYDYLKEPKPDGYRSFHLIFKYQSEYEDKKAFNGQRVEIQIRSRLQHAWATAVETVQTFTMQALKSKIKSGDPRWLRFFALMGSAIALRERCPLVPGTPADQPELVREIRELSEKLLVEEVLKGWGSAVQRLEASPGDSAVFLLVLDAEKKTLDVTPFKKGELEKASKAYSDVEKRTKERPRIQAVLVSVDSVEALRSAYPNYYLDTTAFIEAMKDAIAG